MSDADHNDWSDVEHAASKMFCVWTNGSELEWAEEVWGHLHAAGMTDCTTILESTAALLRLVTLARIYQEFCGLAWDENAETSVTDLADYLEIDSVALGILAASIEPDQFEDASDDYELREAALIAVTDSQRVDIFRCLKAAYGGEIPIYRCLWRTRSKEKDSEGDEFEVTGTNSVALQYVLNGFK